MRPRSSAAIPGSFVSDADDIAVVLRARQVRRSLARLRLALILLVGVGFCGLLGLGMCAHRVCPPTPGCRGMQREAKSNLKAMYVMQESFRAEHDRYAERAVDVGFVPRGGRLRYRYALTDVTEGGFTAWAFGIADDVKGDVWRITDENDLENLTRVCR
jgi:hypothetical protein